MHNYHSSPTVKNCIFTGNSAGIGGGMYNEDCESVISGCVVRGNTANYGGGMQNEYGAVQILDCVFAENSANHSGGLGNSADGVTVASCVFSDNVALVNFAGAVCNSGDGTSFVAYAFTRNFATDKGGAIINSNDDCRIVDCTFDDNLAKSGGAAFFTECGPTLIGCTFSSNSCYSGYGGAIMYENDFANSRMLLSHCSFIDNTALAGGGVYATYFADLDAVNCVFLDNSAFAGGAIQLAGDHQANIANCTFARNMAVEGGALWADTAGITIRNTIMWDHELEPISGWADIRYCCIEGGAEGVGNIDLDPLFVDPDNGDYCLLPGSPCIDPGFNNALPIDSEDLDEDGLTCERFPIDLDGNPRFADDPDTADIGCGVPVVVDMSVFEFVGQPADVVFGDADGNGMVDIDDLFVALGDWGECAGCCLGDANGDGVADIDDVFAVLANWGTCG